MKSGDALRPQGQKVEEVTPTPPMLIARMPGLKTAGTSSPPLIPTAPFLLSLDGVAAANAS